MDRMRSDHIRGVTRNVAQNTRSDPRASSGPRYTLGYGQIRSAVDGPHLHCKGIVHSDGDLLLGPQIPLRCLNRGKAEQELDLLDVPLRSCGRVWRRSWAPKCSLRICFEDRSTIDQTAQSLRQSPFNLPLFVMERNILPLSMRGAVIHTSIACLSHIGIATVRTTSALYAVL